MHRNGGARVICVDTTFLIDLWRIKAGSESRSRTLLAAHRGETFVALHTLPTPLATRNPRHFQDTPGLELMAY